VKPDPELYITEYAAIRIVFTLQGLYTCTHSPKIQSASNSYCFRGTSPETNSYGTNLLPVWVASSRERSPGTVKQSKMGFPRILLIEGYRLALSL
jgi:hypothetical protein